MTNRKSHTSWPLLSLIIYTADTGSLQRSCTVKLTWSHLSVYSICMFLTAVKTTFCTDSDWMWMTSCSLLRVRYGIVGLTHYRTHYRSFRRRFYRWDDPNNSVIALKDNSLPGQGPITQAQHTKR